MIKTFEYAKKLSTDKPATEAEPQIKQATEPDLSTVFHKLKEREHYSYYITDKKEYNSVKAFNTATIDRVFEFAYNMSFGGLGQHRGYRSGGSHYRHNGEIFANAFQGKLAECAVYNLLSTLGDITKPDFDTYSLGKWDIADFTVKGKLLSVKSTKSYGNLLLLETKDWTKNGGYIPNNSHFYEYTILVRLHPDCDGILKRHLPLYSDVCDKNELKTLTATNKWDYDIVGFITLTDLRYIIKEQYILPKGALLNGKARMDAENYYVQAGDMRDITELIKQLN